MKQVQSTKYLGDIITDSGGAKESVEDRRKKDAEISGIVSEMPDRHKIEVGLKMRDSKLCNGMLFSIEAWSYISDREMDRMEQVELALLKTLINGHSKCNRAFYYLEFGLVPSRYMVSIRRLMFHQHILSRADH